MKRRLVAFFDLDGTLTDSSLGITNSLIYALGKMGVAFDVADRKKLRKFIGPPLLDSYVKYCGFSRAEAERGIDFYKEYFLDKGIFENRVYDGVPEMLAELRENGAELVVASAKPEVSVKDILKHFELDGYFQLACGAEADGRGRARKSEVVEYALDSLGDVDRSRILMIGDREDDVLGAKANGLASLGVLYGFGTREELENAGADDLVETVDELRRKLSSY